MKPSTFVRWFLAPRLTSSRRIASFFVNVRVCRHDRLSSSMGFGQCFRLFERLAFALARITRKGLRTEWPVISGFCLVWLETVKAFFPATCMRRWHLTVSSRCLPRERLLSRAYRSRSKRGFRRLWKEDPDQGVDPYVVVRSQYVPRVWSNCRCSQYLWRWHRLRIRVSLSLRTSALSSFRCILNQS